MRAPFLANADGPTESLGSAFCWRGVWRRASAVCASLWNLKESAWLPTCMHPVMDIDRLSESELLTLNRRIVERLKLMQQARQNESMLKFNLGDRVSFDPDGRVRVGILSRYNKKTVTVITEEGQHWTVAPTLLRKHLEHVAQEPANMVRIAS